MVRLRRLGLRRPLLTTYYPLPTTHYPLPTTFYLLPTWYTHYPLPTTYFSLLTRCEYVRTLASLPFVDTLSAKVPTLTMTTFIMTTLTMPR